VASEEFFITEPETDGIGLREGIKTIDAIRKST